MTEPLSGPASMQTPAADTGPSAAGSVADTAKDETIRLTREVRDQTRSLASEARERVTQEAHRQNDRLAEGLRHMAQELDRMAGDRPDSPARSIVARIARSGEQAADYLSKHGPDEVLAEIQDFARRRPGAFLATAAVSGFIVGRIGKGVMMADDDRMSERTQQLPRMAADDVATQPVMVRPQPAAPAEPAMGLSQEPADDRY